MILIAPITYKPELLGWYQTNIASVKTIEVTNSRGEVYQIDLKDFGAHSMFTTFFGQKLEYLLSSPPVKTYTTSYDEYLYINSMSITELKNLVSKSSYTNEELQTNNFKRKMLAEFFVRYFHNRNNFEGSMTSFLPIIGHIYQDYTNLSDKNQASLSDVGTVKNVKIRYREYQLSMVSYDYHLLRDIYIFSIDI